MDNIIFSSSWEQWFFLVLDLLIWSIIGMLLRSLMGCFLLLCFLNSLFQLKDMKFYHILAIIQLIVFRLSGRIFSRSLCLNWLDPLCSIRVMESRQFPGNWRLFLGHETCSTVGYCPKWWASYLHFRVERRVWTLINLLFYVCSARTSGDHF